MLIIFKKMNRNVRNCFNMFLLDTYLKSAMKVDKKSEKKMSGCKSNKNSNVGALQHLQEQSAFY